MAFRINLQNRFSSAFGFVAKNVTPRVADIGLSNGGLYLPLPTFDPQLPRAFGLNGAPVFDMLEFEHPSLPLQQTNEGARNIFRFDMPIMIDASRTKRNSVTQVNENQEAGLPAGEVVESFGWSPWSIRIRGILIDTDNHHYPYDALEALMELVNIHDVLKCNSLYTNALDVTSVYVTGQIGLPSEPNFPDSQPFTLELKSHEPVSALTLT
ncbi:MAG: DUF6046 domain-containing protein [Imperialibacter sp.]|uniref:DUF6046 domain-containing protein n=1 Tax=Imperialibacter sp. TaxID=2038411 RepID=UPI0032EFD223